MINKLSKLYIAAVFLVFSFFNSSLCWGLSVTSPQNGIDVHPGDSIPVVAEPGPTEQIDRIQFTTVAQTIIVQTPPFNATVTIPMDAIGPMKIGVLALNKNTGNLVGGHITVNVTVPPNVSLKELRVRDDQRKLFFVSPDNSHHIRVKGLYSDGIERRIESLNLGTTYQTSDPKVVVVDPEGLATVVGGGKAVITIKNGNKQTQVEAIVSLLQSIEVSPNAVSLSLATEDKRSLQLKVVGFFSDGVRENITESFQETTYQSSNENVVTVDNEGVLHAVSVGNAVITIRNTDKTAQVQVDVK